MKFTPLLMASLLVIASIFLAPRIAIMYGVHCHTCNILDQIEAEARDRAQNSGISIDESRQWVRAQYNQCGENPGQGAGGYFQTSDAEIRKLRQEAKERWNKYLACAQAFLKDHPYPRT